MEVEKKLKIQLFPELEEKLTPVFEDSIPEPSQPYQVQQSLTSHQSTPLSVGIENYIDDKGSIRTRSIVEVRHSLNHMIEERGDIPIGSITREMTTNFKGHIRKIPRNRNKNPKYHDY